MPGQRDGAINALEHALHGAATETRKRRSAPMKKCNALTMKRESSDFNACSPSSAFRSFLPVPLLSGVQISLDSQVFKSMHAQESLF
jgi:hypothetical protein